MGPDSANRDQILCAPTTHTPNGARGAPGCREKRFNAQSDAEGNPAHGPKIARFRAIGSSCRGLCGGQRPGIVLGEVLVLLAVLGVVVMVLAVILGDARRNAQMGQCQTNLRSYASSTGSYASDYEDLMWGFNWLPGQPNPLGVISSDPIQTHGNQAIWIMRERGPLPFFTLFAWVPHPLYSHLVAEDYASGSLPALRGVCPSDINRYKWNRDPVGFSQGVYRPNPFQSQGAPPSTASLRWAFSTTYAIGAALWDTSPDASSRARMGANQNLYIIPSGAKLGQQTLAHATFPSHKVLMAESYGFHHGTRQPFYEYPEARINVLMVDGSVANRSVSDANPGWRPREPHVPSADAQYNYEWPVIPDNRWFPGPLNGLFVERVYTRIRWTRDGIKGRDFDGPEARTGQP